MAKACGNCGNLVRKQESWEMPHIWWWECAARPQMANLRSFPFCNTKCKDHEPIKSNRSSNILGNLWEIKLEKTVRE